MTVFDDNGHFIVFFPNRAHVEIARQHSNAHSRCGAVNSLLGGSRGIQRDLREQSGLFIVGMHPEELGLLAQESHQSVGYRVE